MARGVGAPRRALLFGSTVAALVGIAAFAVIVVAALLTAGTTLLVLLTVVAARAALLASATGYAVFLATLLFALTTAWVLTA